ncbi:MAG TPA: hypothetical protein VE994_16690 [Terriglobales bacterium]|nr:hypothetical protein [Terriglobales bacterium]
MEWLQIASVGCFRKSLILVGALVIAMTSVACSSKSQSAVKSKQPVRASEPVVPESGVPAVEQPTLLSISSKSSSPVKGPASQLITYKSRDYGVSFTYPWQYSFTSAKGLGSTDGSDELKGGKGGSFTLARVDIPRGFYPDTDFESGYFLLSLNEDLSEQECQSTLMPGKDGKLESETIDGVEFHWVQTETGGHGSASTIRNYAGFASGTCYEVEMGVKAKNQRGMSREVDAGQVMRRLDRILQTVKIEPVVQNAAEARVEESRQTNSQQ